MTGYYAGIGSRETPPYVCQMMSRYAAWLRSGGFVLRSGHADGADQAFEGGAEDRAVIFLPWAGFEAHVPVLGQGVVVPYSEELDAYVDHFHPRPEKLTRGARTLMARNTCQILGANLEPNEKSDFVLCWTSDGKDSGGTGQALRIARFYEVPVFNLYHDDADEKLVEFLRSGG